MGLDLDDKAVRDLKTITVRTDENCNKKVEFVPYLLTTEEEKSVKVKKSIRGWLNVIKDIKGVSTKIKSEAMCYLLYIKIFNDKADDTVLRDICEYSWFKKDENGNITNFYLKINKESLTVMALKYRNLVLSKQRKEIYKINVVNLPKKLADIVNAEVLPVINDEPNKEIYNAKSLLKKLQLRPTLFDYLGLEKKFYLPKYGQYKDQITPSLRDVKRKEKFEDAACSDYRCLLCLYDDAKKYLPAGCINNFFEKVKVLSESQRKIVIDLLEKNEPEYVLPIIYYVIYSKEVKIEDLRDSSEVKYHMNNGKQKHIEFLQNAGLSSLKLYPELSNLVNLLGRKSLEGLAKSVKQIGIDKLSFLYNFNMHDIDRILCAANEQNKNLIDVLTSPDEIKDVSENVKELHEALQNPVFAKAFRQKPSKFISVFIKIKEKINAIVLTENQQTKKDKIAELVTYCTKNPRAQDINEAKQTMIWDKFNQSIREAKEKSEKDKIRGIADDFAESLTAKINESASRAQNEITI